MPEVNWIAVIVSAISAFLLGGLWYGPLFGKKWMALTGMTEDQAKSMSMVRTFGLSFLLSLIAAAVFAMFLGPKPGFAFATGAGFAAGLFWVGASYGINDLFENRPFALWAINTGYHTLQFTLFGAILGAMA